MYDYFVKDHLGNTRMTLTEELDSIAYEATMEPADSTAEQSLFLNIAETRSTDEAFVGSHSARLGPESIGPAKMLVVNTGDKVDLTVYAKYSNGFTSTEEGNTTSIGATLASLFGSVASEASVYEQGVYNGLNDNRNSFLASALNAGTSTAPHAYLNYVFFDKDFNYVGSKSDFEQVTSSSSGAFAQLSIDDITIEESGYLYVYLSNEGRVSDGGNVYFDELRITHNKGHILQEDHYYPFGLSINALSSSAPLSKPNQFKYNGKEEQTDFDINWYDYGARSYDAQTGRWFNTDPLAENFYSFSPYNYVENNPMNMVDPDGRSGEATIDKENHVITVTSNFYVYGDGADTEAVDKLVKLISDRWNENDHKVEIEGVEYSIKFDVTGKAVSNEEAKRIGDKNGDNVVNNFAFLTSDDRLKNSQAVAPPGADGTNSFLFPTRDLENSSAYAHEFGHGFIGGYHEIPGSTEVPGIMTAEGTPVGDKWGYDSQPSGQKTMNHALRRVQAKDIQRVFTKERISTLVNTGKVNLGTATNVVANPK